MLVRFPLTVFSFSFPGSCCAVAVARAALLSACVTNVSRSAWGVPNRNAGLAEGPEEASDDAGGVDMVVARGVRGGKVSTV